MSRRRVLRGIGCAGGSLVASSSAQAQRTGASLFDNLFGLGESEPARAASVRTPPAPLNDLRTDPTPWRSVTMLDAMDGAIEQFERIVQRGGWPTIRGSRLIRPEDQDDRIPAVRHRLAVTGEYTCREAAGNLAFDPDLEAAVKRFQASHGLRLTGRVDRTSLAAMNVSAQSRLAQLKLNRERLRELLTTKPEDRYVFVNAAAFQLEAVDRGDVTIRLRAIVGRPGRQTPTIRSSIRAVNFFPYWRVPDSIATLDLIPRLRKDPDYLLREKIRVLRGTFNGPELAPASVDWNAALASQIKFRQDPGPQNALGLMRVDMPNSDGVYLHDTPMKDLFQQTSRAFSAGCVRVQDVSKLVDWLARHEVGWASSGRSEEVIAAGNAVDVVLGKRVPVYFDYITAWVEPSSRQIVFRPDIYGRDGIRDTSSTQENGEAPADKGALTP